MPFSLLLHETLHPYVRGARLLEPWIKLMELQTEMLERARGAFLHRWFGHATPFEGRRPVVAIANIGALRTRLHAVRVAQTPSDPNAPNLLEPLAGMAGSALGLLLSPSGQVALSYAAFRLSRSFVVKAVTFLNMLTLGIVPFALGWLIAGVGLPLSLILAVFVSPELPALLVSFARLGIALRRFWEIISGPRERVANPVLRELLETGDRVAALLTQLVGAFAWLVSRIGPLLEPLANELAAFAALALDLVLMARTIITDLADRLKHAFDEDHSPIAVTRRAIEAFTAAVRHLGDLWLRFGHLIERTVDGARRRVRFMVRRWWLGSFPFHGSRRGAKLAVEGLTSRHPAILPLLALGDELRIAKRMWKATAPPSPPSPPTPAAPPPGGLGPGVTGALLARLVPPTTLPTPPSIPSPAPFAHPPFTSLIGPLATGLEWLEDVVRPPLPPPPARSAGIFAARLEAIRRQSARELRPGPAEAELDAFRTLAERLAGPAAVAQIPRLDPLLRDLQATITGRRAAAERLPVRALGTADVLRSEVRVLRVRIAGEDRAAADRWAATLRSALTSEPVLVPAEG